ncbi:MAG: CBS domain-containing protein [Actinomycetota bacterium]
MWAAVVDVAVLRDVMSNEVYTVSADASMVEAAKGMANGKLGSALIVQGSWLAGIITERDMLRAAASGDDLNDVKVKDWMTKDPLTASPDTDTEEAAATMFTHGFRHLPVTEGNEILGVVSLRDVLSARIRRRS